MNHFEAIKDLVRHADGSLYLSNLARGYMSSRIFLTALELGMFSLLEAGQLPASEIARQLHTDERAAEALLNALAGMGLLRKENNLFSILEGVSDFFRPESPDYLGGSFLHAANQWDAWSHLTQIVKSGKPCNRKRTGLQSEGLSRAMQEEAKTKAEKIVKEVDCTKASRMLDIGGGPGSYSIAFAGEYPHLSVDLFEKNDVALKIAEEEIHRHRLQGRINIRRGDFLSNNFGHGYDIALLSSVVCLLGEEQNIQMLRKVKDSLNHGGRVLILDRGIDESGTTPAAAAIFAVQMIIHTHRGRLYSASEIKEWLRRLGFRNITQIALEHSLFITAAK